MEKCNICYEEKKADEFMNMTEYGCTCKDVHYCCACILKWLKQKGKDAKLSTWDCPTCRIRASDPTKSEEYRIFLERLQSMKDEWIAELHQKGIRWPQVGWTA